jgi:hypothetical protein
MMGRREGPAGSSHIEFESYDPKDDISSIGKIEACYVHPIKLLIFFVLALTVIPLLIIKWFTKARRFLLYSYTNLQNASHLVIEGPSITTSTPHR